MRSVGRRSQRGYTIVEILATMTLFAIGASGVVAMQKATIQGGDDARKFDVATSLANMWAGRLQRDSLMWTLPDSVDTSSNNLAATNWVRDVPSDWHLPAMPTTPAAGARPLSGSPAYNILGREVASNGTDAYFCVQFREQWIVPQTLGTELGAFARAEIRVIWARQQTPMIANCSALPDLADPLVRKDYHFVYLTTAIRENPSR